MKTEKQGMQMTCQGCLIAWYNHHFLNDLVGFVARLTLFWTDLGHLTHVWSYYEYVFKVLALFVAQSEEEVVVSCCVGRAGSSLACFDAVGLFMPI